MRKKEFHNLLLFEVGLKFGILFVCYFSRLSARTEAWATLTNETTVIILNRKLTD
jgi:hypothetical protein